MWGKFVYREIAAPGRIVLVNSFSDEQGGLSRHPMAPTWPVEMLSTTTLTEEGGQTKITIEWVPLNPTDEERRTFDAHDGMKQGCPAPSSNSTPTWRTKSKTMAGSHKAAALSFLRLAGSGKAREAFQRHVAPDFRHHNPWFKGDAESLMRGMEEAAAKFPDKVFEVQRVIEECALRRSFARAHEARRPRRGRRPSSGLGHRIAGSGTSAAGAGEFRERTRDALENRPGLSSGRLFVVGH
jgi:hypothetical protein